MSIGCGCKEVYRFPHLLIPTPLVSALFAAASLIFWCFSTFFYYDERYKKGRFYRSVFGNFLHSGDHWKIILDLKSAPHCRYMSK